MDYLKLALNWIGHNFLAILNLLAFFVLWKTMKATERAAERASKPVILLMRKSFEQPKNEPLRPQRFAELFIPAGMKNVGNGTAIDIHWRFKHGNETVISGMTTQIQPGKIQKTGLVPADLGLSGSSGSCTFECDYLSVDNDRYQTIIKIEKLKITSIETEKL